MLELMTPYEMLDLAMSHTNASVDDLNRALALGSAYLIAAYKVGRSLTTFQVSIINIGFAVFCGQAMWGVMEEQSSMKAWYARAWGEERIAESNAIWAVFEPMLAITALGAIIACFAFMWSVRHPQKE